MKTYLLFILSIPLLLGSCREWHDEGTSGKTDGRAYSGIFFDAFAGVAVGESGLVMHTENRGKTWITGRNRSMCMHAVDAIDRTSYVAAGNLGNVILTTDGGTTWGRKTNVDTRSGKVCKSVSFTGIQNGWVATWGMLQETTDSGATWTPIPLPAGVVMIESIAFTFPGTGYLLSIDGNLYRTANSGRDWDKLSRPTALSDASRRVKFGEITQHATVRFRENSGMFVCIARNDREFFLLIDTTEDGGKTWGATERHSLKRAPSTLTVSPDRTVSILNSDSTITIFRRTTRIDEGPSPRV